MGHDDWKKIDELMHFHIPQKVQDMLEDFYTIEKSEKNPGNYFNLFNEAEEITNIVNLMVLERKNVLKIINLMDQYISGLRTQSHIVKRTCTVNDIFFVKGGIDIPCWDNDENQIGQQHKDKSPWVLSKYNSNNVNDIDGNKRERYINNSIVQIGGVSSCENIDQNPTYNHMPATNFIINNIKNDIRNPVNSRYSNSPSKDKKNPVLHDLKKSCHINSSNPPAFDFKKGNLSTSFSPAPGVDSKRALDNGVKTLGSIQCNSIRSVNVKILDAGKFSHKKPLNSKDMFPYKKSNLLDKNNNRDVFSYKKSNLLDKTKNAIYMTNENPSKKLSNH